MQSAVEESAAADRTPAHLHLTLWLIISLSLGVHLFCLFAQRTFWQGIHWIHYPIHSAIEVSGGLIACFVGIQLMLLQRRRRGTSFNTWISAALLGMGLLDGMHALVHTGDRFVWLHSTATFTGGLLFALVWLPPAWGRRASVWWPLTVAVAAILFGITSLLYPTMIPLMVEQEAAGHTGFTPWAKTLNLCGGFFLFVAAAQLVRTYLRTRNSDDLLFCLHCSLFGAAATMFEQSQLWDVAWWGWHVLRLLAYGVALWFVILTDIRSRRDITKQLRDSNLRLEQRVRERTEALAREQRLLQQANAALEKSNEDLQQFAYIASHDLQEPLRAISGFSELMQKRYEGQLDKQADSYLSFMVDGARRMQTLISNLLEYSQVGTDGEAFAATEMQIVIDLALKNLATAIAESGVKVEVGELPTVQGDQSQLVRLFQNLLANAIKFKQEDEPRIKVSATRDDDFWRFAVADNGIGIEPKDAERIFLIFQRLHNRNQFAGTGIGLAICQRIVQRHGGRIWVESEPEKGSTFFFTLPA